MPIFRTMMYSALCAILAFGVFDLAATVCASDDPETKPLIVFNQLEHDFGNQVAGLILKHSFVFFNKGNAPLFIESVKAGWGCTAVLVSSSDIPPGGEGKIDIEFDTSNRSGHSRKIVTVFTNDPMNRRIQLGVSADIDLQLDFSPRRLWFGSLPISDPVTLSATINGTKINEVTIESIGINASISKDAFSWVLFDERQTGNKIRLDVTVHPDKLVAGKFNYPLVVETNLDATKRVTLILSGDVVGLLSAKPQRILFGNYESDVPMEESVTLTASDSQILFKIVGVDSGDPEVNVTIVSQEPAISQRLLVRFEPKIDRPRFQTQIKVSTDLASQSEILLDVHGFKRREVKKLTPRAIY